MQHALCNRIIQVALSESDDTDDDLDYNNMDPAALQATINRLENDIRNLAVRPVLYSQFLLIFSAKPGEDATNFINSCSAWCDVNGQREAANFVNMLKMSLQGPALLWIKSLAAGVFQDRQRIVASFKDRFLDNANLQWLNEQQLLSRQMMPHEKLEDYI